MKTFLALILVASAALAQDVEKQLKRVSHNANFAVLPVWYTDPSDRTKSGVVGTAFLVTPDGYFITAAHVLEHYKSQSADMMVSLRQRSRDMVGIPFDLIEKDDTHDLALCKTATPLKFVARKENPGTERPVASLHIASSAPVAGEFIAIAGFPLGSWSPAIQFGNVAAIYTTNPNSGRVPAGQRDLIQISASGNMGNSGSPVIELDTGNVIGVIVQAQPAPLFGPLSNSLPLAQSSGIMLAVPASWVNDLLKRHGVTSIAQQPPEGHTSYDPLPEK
ncbi:exported hypothetical protein [Candidatus Sulfotelmatobacter kueseliae]|uniref:Peptidase S1 and S6, chymotrypsin/Hap n=1 Tax=Candidatus Sulfotelmatobacter kueseliae TaxID=2042962 RepID=A0A2U3KP50_9BACT|nr:exported hypothetical protein [Candidatus Sulfotelmatobacter kueseliae]